jgi:hypothetical protein
LEEEIGELESKKKALQTKKFYVRQLTKSAEEP